MHFLFYPCLILGVVVLGVSVGDGSLLLLVVRGLQFYTFLEFQKNQMAIDRYDKNLSF
jgi:hypothetical protein